MEGLEIGPFKTVSAPVLSEGPCHPLGAFTPDCKLLVQQEVGCGVRTKLGAEVGTPGNGMSGLFKDGKRSLRNQKELYSL